MTRYACYPSWRVWLLTFTAALLALAPAKDLVDLGCNPDTGEHLYLIDIEW